MAQVGELIALKIVVVDNIFLLGSGGENHIAEVSKYWSKSHEVQILTPKDNTLIAGLSRLLGLRLYLAILAIYTFRILKTPFISHRGSDIIIAVSHYPQDVLPAIFLHLMSPKSKLIVYHHGILIPPEHGSLLRTGSILYNYVGSLFAIHFSHLIFTVNKSTRNYLLRFGAKSANVKVTDNGVNVTELDNVDNRPKCYDACFLGRLNKSKGVFDLPKIWAIVHNRLENMKLVVVGGGTEEDGLKKLTKNLHLEHSIILTGLISENKKYEVLKNSKVFIFPSYLESWGIAIAEAMVYGLPVVAYNLPAYKEVFEDKIVTVPVGDTDAMAKQVILLLENPEFSIEIGQKGREFVKKYDWRIIAERELMAIKFGE